MHGLQTVLSGVSVAGTVCRVVSDDPAFTARLAARWAPFATDAPADVTLRVTLTPGPTRAELARWRGPFARYARRGAELRVEGPGFRGGWDRVTGHGWIRQPDDPVYLEALLTGIVAARLLEADGFLLHAAAVVADAGARVFFGPSGSGKTTVAALVGAGVITDEVCALRRAAGGWRVSAVPWRGAPLEADLEGLFRLRKGEAPSFRRLGPGEAVRELLGSAFLPRADGPEMERFLGIAADLLRTVPCREMTFAPDRAFWDAIPPPALEAAR
jgi:hypothetical protein